MVRRTDEVGRRAMPKPVPNVESNCRLAGTEIRSPSDAHLDMIHSISEAAQVAVVETLMMAADAATAPLAKYFNPHSSTTEPPQS